MRSREGRLDRRGGGDLLVMDELAQPVHGGFADARPDMGDRRIRSIGSVLGNGGGRRGFSILHHGPQLGQVDVEPLQGLELGFEMLDRRLIGGQVGVVPRQDETAQAGFEVLDGRQQPFEFDDRILGAVDPLARLMRCEHRPESAEQRQSQQAPGDKGSAARWSWVCLVVQGVVGHGTLSMEHGHVDGLRIPIMEQAALRR